MSKIDIDLPCLKYIVDRINTDEELVEFRSFFFKALSNEQLTPAQLVDQYVTKVSVANRMGFDMYSLGGESSDVDTFLSPDVVPELPSSCRKYCQKVLGEDSCCICRICPRNEGDYKNGYLEREYSLIKYAAMSESNIMALKTAVGASKCVFSSLVDFTGEVDNPVPVMIPMTEIFYKEIISSSVFCSDEDPKAKFESDVTRTHIFAAIALSNPAVVDIIAKRRDMAEVVYSSVVNNILSSAEISEEEMGEYVSEIAETCSRVPVVKKKKRNSLSLSDLVDSYKDRTLLGDDGEQASEQPDSDVVYTEDDSAEVDSDAIAGEESDGDTDEHIEEELKSEEELPSEGENNEVEQECPDEPEIGAACVDEPDVDESEQPLIFSDPTGEHDRSGTVAEAEYRSIQNDGGELPLYTPEISSAYLLNIPEYISYETFFVSEISEDRALIYEIVRVGQIYYALVYSRRNRFIAKVDLSNIPPRSFCVMMGLKSIIKITWQPFLSYSLMKRYGVCISNIHSILCMFMLEYPTLRYGGYRDVLSKYISVTAPSSGEMTGSVLGDEFMRYIPYYDSVKRAQMYFYQKSASEKKAHSLFIEYMGLSYLLGNNFAIDVHLFSLDINCRYLFLKKQSMSSLRAGYILAYGINCPSLSKEDNRRIYEYMLMEITRMNFFRKFNVQLIQLSDDRVELFCDEYSFDALKTFIRMLFDRYASEHSLNKFSYVSNIRHVDPEGKSSEMKNKSYPSSLRRAQDELLMPTDGVKVDEEKVRIAKPKDGFKRQNETFPRAAR